jgi:hypothetical protein
MMAGSFGHGNFFQILKLIIVVAIAILIAICLVIALTPPLTHVTPHVQWKPLNGITFGHAQTDNIIRMITINDSGHK